jgi:predicted DNA-binding protein YlxM (UPF0122 family)
MKPSIKKKKKPGSSQADQHIWKEISIQPELFSPVIEIEEATENEIAIIKEAKILIQQLLFDRVVELTSNHFTDHQKIVLALILMPDRTYNEVADVLGINYTAISHAIKGIKSSKHGKFHGGYEKKLRKMCSKDEACQKYINCIQTLRNNDPQDAIQMLIEFDDDAEYWKNYSFV